MCGETSRQINIVCLFFVSIDVCVEVPMLYANSAAYIYLKHMDLGQVAK